MRILGARVRQAHKAIQAFAISDARSRVAQILIKLSQMSSPPQNGLLTIENRFTHQEIANMIGKNLHI